MTALSHIMTSIVVGHLTADPVDHGFTESSGRRRHRCELTVVVTRTDRDPETGETDAHPAFLTIRCKATLARNVLDTVRRGDLVIATGHLDMVERPGPGGRSTQVILVAREVGLALSQTIEEDEA